MLWMQMSNVLHTCRQKCNVYSLFAQVNANLVINVYADDTTSFYKKQLPSTWEGQDFIFFIKKKKDLSSVGLSE